MSGPYNCRGPIGDLLNVFLIIQSFFKFEFKIYNINIEILINSDNIDMSVSREVHLVSRSTLWYLVRDLTPERRG